MLRILSVSIRNFLSIGNVPQTINLSTEGLTLVLGENLDVGGVNSRNGVGKSSILQAICYALFGKPLTKIRLDNLVNAINGKEMLVCIDFEYHGKLCRIERGRKPNVLRFFCDGVQEIDEAQGENRRTQVEIERLVGMSPTLFRHIVALNTFTTPFLREEAAVQREVIEELFGIAQLSQRAETLKKLIDETKEQLRAAEATVKANTEANIRIEQAIERATGDAHTWQTAQDRRLAELTAQVEAHQAIDIEHEIAVFDSIDRWQEQKRDIDGQRQTIQQQITAVAQESERLERQAQLYRTEATQDIQPQITRLAAERTRYRAEIASKESEAQRLAEELADIIARLDHPDSHTCSTCGQPLVGTQHLATVTTNLDRQKERLTGKITRLFDNQDDLTHHIAAAEAEIGDICKRAEQGREQAQRHADELQTALDDLARQRQTLLDHLNHLPTLDGRPVSAYPDREAVWQLHQHAERRRAQLEAESTKANPHVAKIDGLRGTLLAIDYSELNGLTSRHKHETFLHKLLTAKESFIRKTILDQNLKYLNKRVDHYVQELGLPHEVAFAPDLTVDISLLGASFDFEQLSRGEMNRIILANSWGFRDVWESLNTTLNLLFVDEMLDQGTDGAGVEAALSVLTRLAGDREQCVFLVSHREELRERIDNVLIVRKENQFTNFV